MRVFILAAALAALAACGQVTTPASTTQARATGPQSPIQPGVYEAMSTTAAGITGNLTLAADALSFVRDQRYLTDPAVLTPASTVYAQGVGTFAELIDVPSGSTIEIRHVRQADIGDAAHGSTLCGADNVAYIVIGQADDGALKVAAFKGAVSPGPNANAADLCGTFLYAPGMLE